MRKLTSLVLLLIIITNTAFGACDYTKIVKNPDDTFTYTKELHICVGQTKQDLEVANKKIDNLNDAIQLKDLALSKADADAILWKDTSLKLESEVNTLQKLDKNNKFLYFGLGVLSMLAAGYAYSRVTGH